jgi:hypothetical protein
LRICKEKKLFAFDNETGTGQAGAVYDYSDSSFLAKWSWVATAFLTAVCSLLPALMILWLNSVETTRTRIYITIGATAILGFFMKLFTNANLKEVLATTIA